MEKLDKICDGNLNKNELCNICDGKKAIVGKTKDTCPYNFKCGKYQSIKPLLFKNGRVFYECLRLIEKYSFLGIGG